MPAGLGVLGTAAGGGMLAGLGVVRPGGFTLTCSTSLIRGHIGHIVMLT